MFNKINAMMYNKKISQKPSDTFQMIVKISKRGNAVHEFKNNIPFNIRLSGSSIE